MARLVLTFSALLLGSVEATVCREIVSLDVLTGPVDLDLQWPPPPSWWCWSETWGACKCRKELDTLKCGRGHSKEQPVRLGSFDPFSYRGCRLLMWQLDGSGKDWGPLAGWHILASTLTKQGEALTQQLLTWLHPIPQAPWLYLWLTSLGS